MEAAQSAPRFLRSRFRWAAGWEGYLTSPRPSDGGAAPAVANVHLKVHRPTTDQPGDGWRPAVGSIA